MFPSNNAPSLCGAVPSDSSSWCSLILFPLAFPPEVLFLSLAFSNLQESSPHMLASPPFFLIVFYEQFWPVPCTRSLFYTLSGPDDFQRPPSRPLMCFLPLPCIIVFPRAPSGFFCSFRLGLPLLSPHNIPAQSPASLVLRLCIPSPQAIDDLHLSAAVPAGCFRLGALYVFIEVKRIRV